MIRDVSGVKVLVTGGSGLIGRPTVALLLERGAHVRVLDRRVENEASGVESLVGDIRDVAAVRRAVTGVDAVVHLGGIPGPNLLDDITTYEINTVGTYSVFSAAADAGVQKVVYASSINANGLPIGKGLAPSALPYDEDEPATIRDSYSLSKEAGEQAAVMAAGRWGLQLTGLRFPLVRDLTRDDGVAFATHIREALSVDPIRQAYEGWSYLHAADAARAIVCALTHETPPAPGILVAAPVTYLSDDTADAARAVIPDVPVRRLRGRDVGLDLSRSRALLEFEATLLLEDIGFELLASVREGRG